MKWVVTGPPEGTRAALIRQHAYGNDLTLERIENSGMCMSQSSPSLRSTSKHSTRSLASTASGTSPTLQRSLTKLVFSDGPTDRYVEACQRCDIVPTPLPFVTGHSHQLLARGRNLTDNDLRAIAAMTPAARQLEEIDLGGNSLLTEKAIVPFLERLFDTPAASTLRSLCLPECKKMSFRSMDTIARLLTEKTGTSCLKVLDISHLKIAPKCLVKLAFAVG